MKQRHEIYDEELLDQLDAWNRKASLRLVYSRWYDAISKQLSKVAGSTLEVGSGVGNLSSRVDGVISSDVIVTGSWIDVQTDAQQLPFRDCSLSNIVLVDVLHHLPRPYQFLQEAERTLRPDGRLILLEPAGTPWGRFLFGRFHHEPFDINQNILDEISQPVPENPGFLFANQAFATLMFERYLDKTMSMIPSFRLIEICRSDFLVWPATGGFSYWNLIPRQLSEILLNLEFRIVRRWGKLIGLRLLIVLEKSS